MQAKLYRIHDGVIREIAQPRRRWVFNPGPVQSVIYVSFVVWVLSRMVLMWAF